MVSPQYGNQLGKFRYGNRLFIGIKVELVGRIEVDSNHLKILLAETCLFYGLISLSFCQITQLLHLYSKEAIYRNGI